MEISDYFDLALGGLVGAAPALVFWIAVIVFAVVMLQRGGGRPEHFLMAGAGIKIIGNLLRIPATFITLWLVDRGYSIDYASSVSNYCGIFLNIIGMAGILCLVYAFWIKFKMTNGTPKKIPTLERGTYDATPEY
jgi:hypothetical protein